MTLTPRVKLLLLAALFLLPIVASTLAYLYVRPDPTTNYGELVKPGPAPAVMLARSDGSPFEFRQLAGRWILVASDSGLCTAACMEKLATLRQVRVALGRNASRVERLFIVEDGRLAPELADAFPGMVVATVPAGVKPPAGAGGDRAHIYLVDPHGNVMMRWPAAPDGKRMIKDLDRLLRASQIG